MAKKISSIAELVGETPLIPLRKVVPSGAADIYVKLEATNFGGSTKVRTVLNSIEVAEESGEIEVGDTLVEATDGNAGVAVAMFAAAKGYQALLVMPEASHPSVLSLLSAYGAEVVETPGAEGMPGAIAKAEELGKQEGFYYLRQFGNEANAAVHEATTGPEIIEALDGEAPDAFVATVGTGGTLTGVGRALRTENPNVELYAVEPEETQVLSGGTIGEHQIPGISPGFIPPALDVTLYNGVVRVSSQEAAAMAIRLAKEEGLLLGTSSGAAIVGAIEIAKRLGRGKTVVTISGDDGERYLVNQ
ncbi:PLP-dependent cysteine synthase family protein [Jeotgalibaca caeni]|uniref:PLP-dependent cysteine synthase family protein n=1 Tax=Jeotgalibaca caeni TaxID=3028623 RepID=UPI00237ECC89|nr:pyridoxal-phosphate dependent enzyme [Jeotgalibaca caeni]MDE1548071.1 pyridoxal-phosphate dependent enzyme [Jeotgalibaca caeni]